LGKFLTGEHGYRDLVQQVEGLDTTFVILFGKKYCCETLKSVNLIRMIVLPVKIMYINSLFVA
jgi:hypothetical protein